MARGGGGGANFHTSKPNIYIFYKTRFTKGIAEHERGGGANKMLTKVFPKSLCERSLQQ